MTPEEKEMLQTIHDIALTTRLIGVIALSIPLGIIVGALIYTGWSVGYVGGETTPFRPGT